MSQPLQLNVIARIHTDFATKFGIPRQSGLVDALQGLIVFEPEYRNPDALRGIDGYSHLWLIWEFTQANLPAGKWSPTVRPPRLGGNTRMGVFATRSPFRPNRLGLSCVKLTGIKQHPTLGTVLEVAGADLLDGTPIYDIKPYLPYVDSHPDAKGGFADATRDYALKVVFPPEWLAMVPAEKQAALTGVLAGDPRPSYQNDPDRVYGFVFAGLEIRFFVAEDTLTVCGVSPVASTSQEN
ncbi:MAG: tRNA (N6-threonylcarbamoyladenosine(37)-N6)-methyltransferase TrmO [Faecalibacterium sp.]|nr:tRNA (N6-threonylcarbamoyladenosine(37)-N6)-methyltransferase TrmO [Faecalibacterium sp.]